MKGQKGFSLVELAILLVVIGLSGLLILPQFQKSEERAKASEAFSSLTAVQSAQKRYHDSTGVYASNLKSLQMQGLDPQFFDFGLIEPGESGSLEDSWSLTMTRKATDQFKGEYTVTFTDQGYDPNDSTISDLPGISPLQG